MRPQLPGDRDALATFQDEWAFKSRTHTGFVAGLSPRDGTMLVRIPGLYEEHTCEIPSTVSLGQSSAGSASLSIAWQRFMPHIGAVTNVSFGADNRAVVDRFAFQGAESALSGMQPGEPPGAVGGYATLATFNERVLDDQPSGILAQDGAPRTVPGLEQFMPLEPGEWDMRSSGGAYIWGSNAGQLHISSGLTESNWLVRDNSRRSAGALSVDMQNGSELRIGQIMRAPMNGFPEEAVGLATLGSEYVLRVATEPPVSSLLVTRQTYFETRAGVLFDQPSPGVSAPGVPIPAIAVTPTLGATIATAGQPLVYRSACFVAGGAPLTGYSLLDAPARLAGETLVVEVDALGNCGVRGYPAALPTSAFDVTVGTMSLNALTTMSLSTPLFTLNSGGAATAQMVLGDVLVALLQNAGVVVPGTGFVPLTTGPLPSPILWNTSLSAFARLG